MSDLLKLIKLPLSEGSTEFKNLSEGELCQLEEFCKTQGLNFQLKFCRLLVYRCDYQRLLRYSSSEVPQIRKLCCKLLHVPKIEKALVSSIKTLDEFNKMVAPLSPLTKQFMVKVAIKYVKEDKFFEEIYLSEDPHFEDAKLEIFKKLPLSFFRDHYEDSQHANYYHSKSKEIRAIIANKYFEFLDECLKMDESSYNWETSPYPDFRNLSTERRLSKAPVNLSRFFHHIPFENITYKGQTKSCLNFVLDYLKKFQDEFDYTDALIQDFSYSSSTEIVGKYQTNKPQYKKLTYTTMSNAHSFVNLLPQIFDAAPVTVVQSLNLFQDRSKSYYITYSRFQAVYTTLKNLHLDEQAHCMVHYYAKSFFSTFSNQTLFVSCMTDNYEFGDVSLYRNIKQLLTEEEYKFFLNELIQLVQEECAMGMLQESSILKCTNCITYIYLMLFEERPQWMEEEKWNTLQTYAYRLDKMRSTTPISPQLCLSILALLGKQVPFSFRYVNGSKEMKEKYPKVHEFEKHLCSQSNSYLFSKDNTQRQRALHGVLLGATISRDASCVQRVLHALVLLLNKDTDSDIYFPILRRLLHPSCLGFDTKTEEETKAFLQFFLEDWNELKADVKSTLFDNFTTHLLNYSVYYSTLYPEYDAYYSVLYSGLIAALHQTTMSFVSILDARKEHACLRYWRAHPRHTLANSYLYEQVQKQEEAIRKNEVLPHMRNNKFLKFQPVQLNVQEYDYADYVAPLSKNIIRAWNDLIVAQNYADTLLPLLKGFMQSVVLLTPFTKDVIRTDFEENLSKGTTINYSKFVDRDFYNSFFNDPCEDSSITIPGLSIYRTLCAVTNSDLMKFPKDDSIYESYTVSYTDKKAVKRVVEEIEAPDKSFLKEIKKQYRKYENKTTCYPFCNSLVERLFLSNLEKVTEQLTSYVASIPSLAFQRDTYIWYYNAIEKIVETFSYFKDYGLEVELQKSYNRTYSEDILKKLYAMAVDSYYVIMEAIYFCIYYAVYNDEGKNATVEVYHKHLYRTLYYILQIQHRAGYQKIELPTVERDVYVYCDLVAHSYEGIQMEEEEKTTSASATVALTDIQELLKPLFVTFDTSAVQSIFMVHKSRRSSGTQVNDMRNLTCGLSRVFPLLSREDLKKLCMCFLSVSSSVAIVRALVDHYMSRATNNSSLFFQALDLVTPEQNYISTQYITLLFNMSRQAVMKEVLYDHPVKEIVEKWNGIFEKLWSLKTLATDSCFYMLLNVFEDLWTNEASYKYLEKIGNMKNKTTTENSFILCFVLISSAFFKDSNLMLSSWTQGHFKMSPHLLELKENFESNIKSKLDSAKADEIRRKILEVYSKLRNVDLKDTNYALFNMVAFYSEDTSMLASEVPFAKSILYSVLLVKNSRSMRDMLNAVSVLRRCEETAVQEILKTCVTISNAIFKLRKSSTIKTLEEATINQIYQVLDACSMSHEPLDVAMEKKTEDELLNTDLSTVFISLLSFSTSLYCSERYLPAIRDIATTIRPLIPLMPLCHQPALTFLITLLPRVSVVTKDKNQYIHLDNLSEFIQGDGFQSLSAASVYTLLSDTDFLYDRLEGYAYRTETLEGYKSTHNVTSALLLMLFYGRKYYIKGEDATVSQLIYADMEAHPCLAVFAPFLSL